MKKVELDKYIEQRKEKDEDFSFNFDEGYQNFKIGAMLRLDRKKAGITQEELAERLNTKKSAISRIENRTEDIKISTLERVATALNKHLKISLS